MSLTLRQLSEDKPAKPLGWYLYQANFTVNFEPVVTLSSERATQGDVVAILLTGILDGTPEAETDLGSVWFRPVTGGWMGYIPVSPQRRGRQTRHHRPLRRDRTAGHADRQRHAVRQCGDRSVGTGQRRSLRGLPQRHLAAVPVVGGRQTLVGSVPGAQRGRNTRSSTAPSIWWTVPATGSATGLTYAAPNGSDVFSPQAGKVVYAGTLEVSGGTVVIDHGCGVKSYLFGLGEVTVQRGQTVAKGDVVGKATDQHDLIYEVRIGNKSVDPEKILSGKSGLQYKETM